MIHPTVAQAWPGIAVAAAIWLGVVPIGLRGVFGALGVNRSRAWIPFVNLATVFRLGGLSEFWLIALVIPVVDVVGAIMLFVASHRIGRRLGVSGWYTVLAVVLWWVWALVVGLQAHAPVPVVPRQADPSSDPAPPAVPRSPAWVVRPESERPEVPPSDGDESAVPAYAPQPAAHHTAVQGQNSLASSVPPMPDPSEVGLGDPAAAGSSTGPAPAGASGLLGAADDEDATAPPVIVLPSQPPVEPALDEDDATVLTGVRDGDATVVSLRRRARWRLHTTAGTRLELTGPSAILGRRPGAHPLYPGAQLIAVTDDARSVSATHAVLEYIDERWQVTDLDSTNGVWLVDPETGAESELGSGNRATMTPVIMLGELGVSVVPGV